MNEPVDIAAIIAVELTPEIRAEMRATFLRDVIRAADFFLHEEDPESRVKLHDILCITNAALDGHFDDRRGVRLSELLNEGLLGAAKDGCEGHA